jgi:hypothetical protein
MAGEATDGMVDDVDFGGVEEVVDGVTPAPEAVGADAVAVADGGVADEDEGGECGVGWLLEAETFLLGGGVGLRAHGARWGGGRCGRGGWGCSRNGGGGRRLLSREGEERDKAGGGGGEEGVVGDAGDSRHGGLLSGKLFLDAQFRYGVQCTWGAVVL